MSQQQVYKEKLLETGLFRRVREGQYKCQYCPFCGDSKWHMYVMIKLTDDTPVLYNCFKCNSHGRLNKNFLEYYNIDHITIPRNSSFRKKIISPKASSVPSELLVDERCSIDFVCEYIQSKVGHYPTLAELQYFQYVGDPKKYAMEYLGYDGTNDKVFKDRNWFRMTNGNIIGRWKDDNTKVRWYKYLGKVVGRGLYTIKLPVDLYQQINVCIVEGVMDAIGLYYNYPQPNSLYIACLGKDYSSAMRHVISLGIFGDGVDIKIFKDSDVKTNAIRIDERLRSLFNNVDIYQNIADKDYGVLPDKLDVQKASRVLKSFD